VTEFRHPCWRFWRSVQGCRALSSTDCRAQQRDEELKDLVDPWGEPYHYAQPGKHAEFDIYTLGSDHREGGEGDARGEAGTKSRLLERTL
jgi:hypothetical protein